MVPQRVLWSKIEKYLEAQRGIHDYQYETRKYLWTHILKINNNMVYDYVSIIYMMTSFIKNDSKGASDQKYIVLVAVMMIIWGLTQKLGWLLHQLWKNVTYVIHTEYGYATNKLVYV